MTAADKDAEKEVPEGAEAPAEQGVLRIYPPTGGAYTAELGECRTAFNRGDTGSARRLAQAVLKATDASQDERGFAEMILQRTGLDAVAIGVGLGCFALFWFVIYWFLWR